MAKDFTPVAISLDYREALKILPTISTSQLVVVDVEGARHTTLVREKQREPSEANCCTLISLKYQ